MSETVSIVVSIFGLIGLGYLTVRVGLLSVEVGDRLSDFVFTLAIPLLLFTTLATADFHGLSPWRIWAAYFIPLAIIWVAGDQVVAPPLRARPARRHRRRRIGRLFERGPDRAAAPGSGARASRHGVHGRDPCRAPAGADGDGGFLNEWVGASDGGEGSGGSRRAVFSRLGLSLVGHPILIGIFAGSLWRVTGSSSRRSLRR